jgi:hypothetical protein
MKKIIFTLTLLAFAKFYGQGFAPAASTWNVPTGGEQTSVGNWGFNATYGSSQFVLAPNSQSWGIMDMDGDKKKDLVVWSINDASGLGKVCGYPSTPHWRVYLNNGSSFASTYITWTVPSGGLVNGSYGPFGFNNSSGDGLSNAVVNSQSWNTMDINGDGKPDLVVTAQNDASAYSKTFGLPSTPHWQVYLNTGSGFATTATNWSIPTGGFQGASSGSWGYNFTSGSGLAQAVQNSQTWSTIDINGDAKPDLVVTAQNDASGYSKVFNVTTSPYWNVYLNNGSSFASSPTVWSVPSGGLQGASSGSWGFFTLGGSGLAQAVANSQSWGIADMDGDGKPDLVVTAQNDASIYTKTFGLPSTPYWKVYSNTGTGFSGSPITWNVPVGGYESSAGNWGFNAFGGSALSSTQANFQSWSTVDLNGDKKPDLIVSAQNDASGNTQIFNATSSPYWKMYVNTGSGFSASPNNWSVPVGGYQSVPPVGFCELSGSGEANAQPNFQTWSTTDINGDDKADLVVTANDDANSYSLVFGLPSSPHWNVFMNTSTVGLKENNTTNLFSVYPNPNIGKFEIRSANDAKELGKIEIYNAVGQKVYSAITDEKIFSVNMSNLASGIYYLKTENGTQKIIKE